MLLAGLMAGILGGVGLAYFVDLMREKSPPAAQPAGQQPVRKTA
jgi:hypothetical protein